MARFDSAAFFDAGFRFDEAVPPVIANRRKARLMPKFKLDLANKTPDQKITLGGNHVTAMTGNAAFPAAGRVPTDAQFQAALDALQTSHADVAAKKTAWKQAIETRDAAEDAFDVTLTSRAAYCEAAKPDDDAALASTGLPMRGDPVPVGDLPAPGNLAATAGDQDGEVDLSCDRVGGARSYEWQCRPHTDATAWQPVKTSTVTKITVGSLTPGTVYAFRVRALGTTGQSPWSDEAVKRAP